LPVRESHSPFVGDWPWGLRSYLGWLMGSAILTKSFLSKAGRLAKLLS
jgi:hypothetical protein